MRKKYELGEVSRDNLGDIELFFLTALEDYLKDRKNTLRKLSLEADICPQTLYNMKGRHCVPSTLTIEKCLYAMGYELIIRKVK